MSPCLKTRESVGNTIAMHGQLANPNMCTNIVPPTDSWSNND